LIEKWALFAAGWGAIGIAVIEVVLVVVLTLRAIQKEKNK